MRVALLMVALVFAAAGAEAADPPLARARMLYNAADYDGAIAAAGMARAQANTADAAALVEARARLERFRRGGDAMDLTGARLALNATRPALLSPRDQVDYLIGLGQSLYLAGLFGSAAELFDTSLERSAALPERDRQMLLDWWATALDRDAQGSSPERRARLAAQIAERMDEELRRDPGSVPANYWLAVAARASGDLDTAWDAAVAAWVRATLSPASMRLRADVDRLVMEVLIPERARVRRETTDVLRAQWNTVKEDWK
jgi:tetratricopeptide (TPR) repeat protein